MRFRYAALSLIPLGFLAYLVSLTGSGFDFTDEAAAINWLSDPYLYSLSHSQYGYFYHPAFLLAGGDIVLLRAANLVVTAALGSLLGLLLITDRREGEAALDTGATIAASIAFGCTALLGIANWLVTPHYNTLNLQGLLVTAIGLLLARRERPAWFVAGHLLIGVGGWMTFMAKPSSALLLAPAVGACLLASGSLRLKPLLLAVATAGLLLLATAFAIDGSPVTFAMRVKVMLQLVSATDPGHDFGNVLRLDRFDPIGPERWMIAASGAAFCLVLALSMSGRRAACVAVALAAGVAAAAAASVAFGWTWPYASGWQLRYGLQILALPAGAVLFVLGSALLRRLPRPRRSALPLALLFFVLPYFYAFGTNGNVWNAASCAGIFWAAIGLVAVSVSPARAGPSSLIAAGFLPFAITAIILGIGLQYPYRQSLAVRMNEHTIRLLDGRTALKVPEPVADYVTSLQRLAKDSGFASGTPLIDLTGHFPGASAALGAASIGQAWMIGGYPGSNQRASATLLRVPCQTLAKAWLLVEPGGPRALSQSVIGDYGLRYESVGLLTTAPGDYPMSFRQMLMRPLEASPASLAACASARQGGSPQG